MTELTNEEKARISYNLLRYKITKMHIWVNRNMNEPWYFLIKAKGCIDIPQETGLY